jgi:hypothetical protein
MVRVRAGKRWKNRGHPVHDIIGDILDWDQAHKAYPAGKSRETTPAEAARWHAT